MKPSSFHIYDASAGSGKTFALTKSYLMLLLASVSNDTFKSILAITFTNKAVGEMKDRIIETLKVFSSTDKNKEKHPMLQGIMAETGLSAETIYERSDFLLKYMLHNYGGFEISTIDSFVHRIIRTFSHDLRLPGNFEVEIDQDRMLSEAVDHLISKAGDDKVYTDILIDFAIEKSDLDKSYDIAFDLNKIAKLLISENDLPYLQELKSKNIQDFLSLKVTISNRLNAIQSQLKKLSADFKSTLIEQGVDPKDFKGRYHLPYYYEKIDKEDYPESFDAGWQNDLVNGESLYAKTLSSDKKAILDRLQPELASSFEKSKNLILQHSFQSAIYQNITPLSVLKAIQDALETLKTDQDKILISEFNSIIHKEIANQPTPFIYERLGEKFNHHFIDEFQDTSQMQWTNLIPLIQDTLAAEGGSATIVGDAKQAIYRWRGGEAGQFMNLVQKKENPFFIEASDHKLKFNFRSTKTIVDFNNDFFSFLSETNISTSSHAELYAKAAQESSSTKEGYVKLHFSDIKPPITKDETYPLQVLQTIKDCLERGHALSDICIIVRKRKEGVAIGEFIGEHGIPISSSETLLLKNSNKIRFLTNFLKLLTQPDNQALKSELLYHFTDLKAIADKHQFIADHLDKDIQTLIQEFSGSTQKDTISLIPQLPLFELVEHFIRLFNLNSESDAYLQFYLDLVLELTRKGSANLLSLVEYYDENIEKLSIVAPEHQEAVQIMTIHKCKGLEFPIVLFPYADLNLFDDRNSQIWVNVNPEDYNGFSTLLMNASAKMESYNEETKALYQNHRAAIKLDHINLLYVALTRAELELHIFSQVDTSTTGKPSETSFAGLFISFLSHLGMWNSAQSVYEFGKAQQIDEAQTEAAPLPNLKFISVPKEAHHLNLVSNSGMLWDSKQGSAIEQGNLLHHLMSKIKTTDDLDMALDEAITEGLLKEINRAELLEKLHQIVNHPELKQFYSGSFDIKNECDILDENGESFRPDRLCFSSNKEVHIIDYKSGSRSNSHNSQISQYEQLLVSMGFAVKSKLLVYINDHIEVIEV